MRTDRRTHLIGIAAAGVEFPDPVGGNPDGQDSVHPDPDRADSGRLLCLLPTMALLLTYLLSRSRQS